MKSRPDLLPDLRRFVATSIPSVPYLEAVLLLRAEPDSAWTAAAMARRLYLPEADTERLLADAAQAGIATAAGAQEPRVAGVRESLSYRYQPVAPELAHMLDRLAAHYAVDLVTITDLIHTRVDKRAHQFAEGFRWRKDS